MTNTIPTFTPIIETFRTGFLGAGNVAWAGILKESSSSYPHLRSGDCYLSLKRSRSGNERWPNYQLPTDTS